MIIDDDAVICLEKHNIFFIFKQYTHTQAATLNDSIQLEINMLTIL
jgi:hypothetical protein